MKFDLTTQAGAAVVAIGGNAITREYEEGEIHEQFANTRRALNGVLEMVRHGWKVMVLHGNGPQVGNALIRVEMSRQAVPYVPLGVLVADVQGGMGYMIQQSLQNRLLREGIDRRVVTLVTQVIVDRNDPSILHPTKPIGPFYSKEDADVLIRKQGWNMIEDSGRGWRRVVPSPKPVSICESKEIKHLLDAGVIVIAGGGGGIPVYVEDDGTLEGIDAVIDKDRTALLSAREIGADTLVILTQVERVYVNFGKPTQKPLERVSIEEIRRYQKEGQFPPGSMGPKIEACLKFIEAGGRQALITSAEKMSEAVAGTSGTLICKVV
jgi:carbamate kinase